MAIEDVGLWWSCELQPRNEENPDDILAIDGFGIEDCLLRPRHAEDFDVLANSRRARRRRGAGTGCQWQNDALKLARHVILFPRCLFCANAQ